MSTERTGRSTADDRGDSDSDSDLDEDVGAEAEDVALVEVRQDVRLLDAINVTLGSIAMNELDW